MILRRCKKAYNYCKYLSHLRKQCPEGGTILCRLQNICRRCNCSSQIAAEKKIPLTRGEQNLRNEPFRLIMKREMNNSSEL